MFRVFLASLLIVCGLAASGISPARAQSSEERVNEPVAEVPATLDKSAFTLLIYFENDLFYGQDRYYTNAVQMRLISPDLSSITENNILPGGFSRALGGVPFPGRGSASQFNISFGLGQQIYTPEDTQDENPDPDDRPYAGYLYGLLALHAKQQNRLDTLELAAGVIGPSSLAEEAQNEVHSMRGINTAKGWDHQLHDEPAVMLTWTRIWRLNADHGAGWAFDLLPRVGLSAGTPFTNASLGGELRFGWNLPPDYGSSSIRPGSGINAPAGDEAALLRSGDGLWDNISAYVFVGAEGRAVAYNSFLDGNLWKDSPSVDKFPLVGDLSAGVALNIYNARLAYTYIHRSNEFHGQSSGQDFGSVTVGYAF